jgi:hypothetical protein
MMPTTPDTITPTGTQMDPGVAENLAALSPCPVCGANQLEGPEGWAWSHIPHCFRCGYNWKRPAPTTVNAPSLPSLPPAQVAALARAVVDQLRTEGWNAPPDAIAADSAVKS